MSPQTSSSARESLVAAHRLLVEQAREEIEGSLTPPPAEFLAYQAEYQRIFERHQGPVPRDALLTALDTASIVYFGDYHTLRESQKAPIRFLRRAHRRGRRIILATEVVHMVHQDYLDAYLRGSLTDAEFLERIDYDRTWGFNWKNFRPQFEFAREKGLRMLALNSDPALIGDNLMVRDAMAATVIVEALARHPDTLIAVIFGDLHVAPAHLPEHVNRQARRRFRPPPKRVIVYQNAEAIYWDLVASGQEQNARVVRVDDESFCLLNSTPLVKYQSYLNWQYNEEELEESSDLDEDEGPSISSNIMTEQVLGLVHTITRFLGLSSEGYDDFTVHTSRDLDFLDRLESMEQFTPEELHEIRQQVLRDESYFIPRGNHIYLGNLSVDHAAEEATHYINTKLAGHTETVPDRRHDFYYRTMKEAIGFFGSKVINHNRRCEDRPQFQRFLARTRGRRLDPVERIEKQICVDVIQHLDYEERWLLGQERGYPRYRSIYERDIEVHIGVTHHLGYLLGRKLHDALMAGRIRRNEIRHLFRERFESPDSPRECYFDWIDYLRGS